MRPITLLIVSLLVIGISCPAQTAPDKADIYKTVVQSLSDKNIPLLNETITRIYSYDIDGDYAKWYFRRNNPVPPDSSVVLVQMICVIPIRYSQPLTGYFISKNISADIPGFLYQANHPTPDRLAKYIPGKKLVSWKRAPLTNSALINFFKKKKVIGLSSILFDQENKIALVKVQVYSRKRLHSENSSKIVILNKVGTDWIITGSLDENETMQKTRLL